MFNMSNSFYANWHPFSLPRKNIFHHRAHKEHRELKISLFSFFFSHCRSVSQSHSHTVSPTHFQFSHAVYPSFSLSVKQFIIHRPSSIVHRPSLIPSHDSRIPSHPHTFSPSPPPPVSKSPPSSLLPIPRHQSRLQSSSVTSHQQ